MEEHSVLSLDKQFERTVWMRRGTPSGPLCVFLDGEIFLNRMDLGPVLELLGERQATCVFVSNVDAAARHRDFTCNPDYGRFIASDLVDWVGGAHSFSDRVVVGLSLSGLEASYIALSHPAVFSKSLSQSGSYWWNDEWLSRQRDLLSASSGKFWLSVGDEERGRGEYHPPSGLVQGVDQGEGVERFARELRACGHEVLFNRFSGGHALEPWQQELPAAFDWLLT